MGKSCIDGNRPLPCLISRGCRTCCMVFLPIKFYQIWFWKFHLAQQKLKHGHNLSPGVNHGLRLNWHWTGHNQVSGAEMKIPAMFIFSAECLLNWDVAIKNGHFFGGLRLTVVSWALLFDPCPRLLNSFYPVDNILNGIKAGALMLPGARVCFEVHFQQFQATSNIHGHVQTRGESQKIDCYFYLNTSKRRSILLR